MDDRTQRWGSIGIGGLVPVAAAVVLVPVRVHVVHANLALVLMATVVVVAVVLGPAGAASAAVMAALSFDFFCTQPYLPLAVDSRDDVETAILLLAVGLLVGSVAARAAARGAALASDHADLVGIHRLADLVVTGEQPTDVAEAATRELTRLLSLRSCRFWPGPPAADRARIERSGVVEGPPRAVTHHRVGRCGLELPEDGVEQAVVSRGSAIGHFELVPTPGVGVSLDRRIVAVAVADQVGAVYPLAVTGVARVGWGDRADGQLVERDGEVVGSSLIGQPFVSPWYFHPRPSAAGAGYDGAASSGSNLGRANPALLEAVEERVAAYREENELSDDVAVPVDAVTASGSGLDPHISVANARLQAARVADARLLPIDDVLAMIDDHVDDRPLGILGDPGVNVLELNLALDDAPVDLGPTTGAS